MSFLEKLQVANAEALAHTADLWLAPLERVRGKVEFRNVGFAYGSAPVLRGLNLIIPAGSTVAIVGTSSGA